MRWLLWISVALGSTVFWWAPTATSSQVFDAQSEFSGWPQSFENQPLELEELDAIEREFALGFPGRIARFRQPERRVVLAWLPRATRAFHFASLCLRGRGWTLRGRPFATDEKGRRWAVREALRGSERVLVRQRLTDTEGRVYFDESAWYWATLRGETQGPWMAWTVVEALRSDED